MVRKPNVSNPPSGELIDSYWNIMLKTEAISGADVAPSAVLIPKVRGDEVDECADFRRNMSPRRINGVENALYS